MVVAGPNGAGKTTWADQVSIGTRIDPDAIAKAKNPNNPASAQVEASRETLKVIREHLEAGQSFTQETTLSSFQPIKTMKEAQEKGFQVGLVFIALANASQSQERVAERVLQGGHDIPSGDIARRFDRSLERLEQAMPHANMVQLVTNQGADFRLVRAFEHDRMSHRSKDVPASLSSAVEKLESLALERQQFADPQRAQELELDKPSPERDRGRER